MIKDIWERALEWERAMHALDLFAGGGGWAVAAQCLDLATTCVENDDAAIRTLRAAGFYAQQRDVRDVEPDPEYDMLIGSPPCGQFSRQGQGQGRTMLDTIIDLALNGDVDDLRDFADDDDDYSLVLEPLRLALGSDFQRIVMEQVPSVMPVWKAVAVRLRREGYRSTAQLVRSETFGVPQTRTRAIMAATKAAEGLILPRETHRVFTGRTANFGVPGLKPWRSMGEVLPRTGDWTYRGTARDKSTERHLDEPAPAVSVGHASRDLRWRSPSGDEQISLQELSLLQSFSPDHPWRGLGPERYQQVANAVPPLMGIALLGALWQWRWEQIAEWYAEEIF